MACVLFVFDPLNLIKMKIFLWSKAFDSERMASILSLRNIVVTSYFWLQEASQTFLKSFRTESIWIWLTSEKESAKKKPESYLQRCAYKQESLRELNLFLRRSLFLLLLFGGVSGSLVDFLFDFFLLSLSEEMCHDTNFLLPSHMFFFLDHWAENGKQKIQETIQTQTTQKSTST